jgi:hypothetical protein
MADVYRSYRVRVTHDSSMSADVTIKAKSQDEAEEMVLELARNGDPKVKWEQDDGNNVRPYIPDARGTEDLGAVIGKCRKCGSKVASKKFREHLAEKHKVRSDGLEWDGVIELFDCES